MRITEQQLDAFEQRQCDNCDDVHCKLAGCALALARSQRKAKAYRTVRDLPTEPPPPIVDVKA